MLSPTSPRQAGRIALRLILFCSCGGSGWDWGGCIYLAVVSTVHYRQHFFLFVSQTHTFSIQFYLLFCSYFLNVAIRAERHRDVSHEGAQAITRDGPRLVVDFIS